MVSYVKELADYLVDFLRRSQPLFELDKSLTDYRLEFEKSWLMGNRNWQGPVITTEMDVDDEDISRDRNHSLYCDVCKRKFAKDTVFEAHKNGKRHKLALQRKQAPPARPKELLWNETVVHKLAAILGEQIQNTKDNVNKKLARTYNEIMAELDEESEEDESEEEEEEEIRVGIQNYPVGWDGKPIPYWLYKLHGLGVEYKCEICGNQSYWGRRAFERHFSEWRHAHGMRCLGIPNTRHFFEITKIKDAIDLYKKIQQDEKKREWKPEVEEEFEDNEGNVFNKKTYEDLKRQGLIS